MVKNRSSILLIIAFIMGASGLGVGAFSIINVQMIEGPQGPPGQNGQDGINGVNGKDGVNGTQGPPGTIGILVGVWEKLLKNTNFAPYNLDANFLIELSENQFNNTNYCYLSRNNTRFHLNKTGWYHFNLLIECSVFAPGVLSILKNGIIILNFDLIPIAPPAFMLILSYYLISNGIDYYEFRFGTSLLTGFFGQSQFVIEYVGGS